MESIEKIPVKSGDGVSSRVTVFRSTDPQATVIICMPAMGVRASYYEPMARALLKGGWNVMTADLRGKGESAIRAAPGCDFGYHEMVFYDWPAVVDQAKRLFPGSRVVLLGHSLGGQLSTLYMGASPGQIAALIMVACPSVYCGGFPFPHNLRILLMTQTFRFISLCLGYFPGKRIGFAGTEAKTHIKDWAHTTLTGRYEPVNSSRNYEKLVQNLKGPVLSVSFSDDPFAPEKAVEKLLSKLPEADITHWQFTPQEMGVRALGHVGWVKCCGPIVKRMSDWLMKVVY